MKEPALEKCQCLMPEPRSASVTTIEPCQCLMLTQQQLYDAIDDTPGIAVNIIRLLSRRIRELNQDINRKQQQTSRQDSWSTNKAAAVKGTTHASPSYSANPQGGRLLNPPAEE